MSLDLTLRLTSFDHGKEKAIEATLCGKDLGIDDDEATIIGKGITIQGSAYTTRDHLVIHTEVHVKAQIPCKICNEFFEKSIDIPPFYLVTPLKEIKNHEFNFAEKLKDAILLEIPDFGECRESGCPHRSELKEYLGETE